MVASQPSLIQMLEALRPIQAPVVARVPAVPPPIHIPVDDGKEEVGPEVMVPRTPPIVEPDSALVSAGPASSSSFASPSSSSSNSSSSFSSPAPPGGPQTFTHDYLNRLNVKDGASPTLMELAGRLNIVGRHNMNKEPLIQAILAKNPAPKTPWR